MRRKGANTMEKDLRVQIAAARNKLACFDALILKLKRKRLKQRRLLDRLDGALAAAPEQLYFSNVSPKPWPTILVWEITDRCGIADKLYTSDDPTLKLLIRPSLRLTLHITHMFKSPAVARYHHFMQDWMSIDNWWYNGQPRWKHYAKAPTLRAMSDHFQTKRFVLGNMVLTMLCWCSDFSV